MDEKKPKDPDEIAEAEKDWFEKTRAEREKALVDTYGPYKSAVPFPPEMKRASKLPKASILSFPPDPARKRPHWLQMTFGLSQPLAAKDVGDQTNPDNPARSRFGFELGFATKEAADWAPRALFMLAKYTMDTQKDVRAGVRMHFGFARRGGSSDRDALHPFAGVLPPEMVQAGDLMAVILWPGLDRDGPFVTSTGRFDLLIATGITQDEFNASSETSSAHVIHLLNLAGIGQRTDALRRTVTTDEKWKKEWDRVKVLSRDAVLDALYGPA